MRYTKHRNRCDHCAELDAQIEYANKLLAYFMEERRVQSQKTAKKRIARGTEDFPRAPTIPAGAMVLGKRPKLDRLERQIQKEFECAF